MKVNLPRMRIPATDAVYLLIFALLLGGPATAKNAECDLVCNEIGRVLGMDYVRDGNTTKNAECDLVRNEIGRVLGMDYVRDGNTTRGELGICRLEEFEILVFFPCIGNNTCRSDLEYFRRRSNNCSEDEALWPYNLMTYVTVALSRPVQLTGPKTGCGVCMRTPFADFELPDGVKIIDRETLEQIVRDLDAQDETRGIRELLPERTDPGSPESSMPSLN